MEVKEFERARNKRLGEFESHYDYLKQQYLQTLHTAIQETDPSKQQDSVNKVLQINSDLSNEIRGILTDMSKTTEGEDTSVITEKLTQDLIQYQQDFQKIKQGKDRVQTLKSIYANDSQKLSEVTTMYNIYLASLIGLSFFIVYLAFRTSVTTMVYGGPTISPLLIVLVVAGALGYFYWDQISSYFTRLGSALTPSQQ